MLVAPCCWLTAFFCCVLLGGCARLPTNVLPASVHKPATSDTWLGLTASKSVVKGRSAARILHTGDIALDARLSLVARASRSIDAQYYHIGTDDTGLRFLLALRDAAARGVRVRLLVDDLYSEEVGAALHDLSLNPGVEVRLFNPFVNARGGPLARLVGSWIEFERLNRRMHNKLLMVDGAFAIAGGRNMADEYFGRSRQQTFFDLDLLVAGTVVPTLATIFDAYWNSRHSFPIEPILQAVALASLGPESSPAQPPFPSGLPNGVLPALVAPDYDALGGRAVSEELENGFITLVPADIRALADSPEKAAGKSGLIGDIGGTDHSSLFDYATTRMAQSQTRLTLVGPYNIPGKTGIDRIRASRARGLRIDMLTNSLLTTDETLAYAAYGRYRVDMLRLGVELYELSARPTRRILQGAAHREPIMRLHTKCTIFDSEALFVGSLNLDPRSREHNTELGLMVLSPTLAAQARHVVDAMKTEAAYRVVLDSDGATPLWMQMQNDGTEARRAPSELGLWPSLWLKLLTRIIPESLL